MLRSNKTKLIIAGILLVIIIISIVVGIVSSNSNDKIKKIDKDKSFVVNEDVTFNIKDTNQYTLKKLRFNLPKEFKKKRVGNNVFKYSISTKDEKGTLTITNQITKKDAKSFMIDEFGFDKSDNFKDKKINKVVWLKVKKNNIYGYAIKQRGSVYGIRYSYARSKSIAKAVPKILEETMYFKVYYNDEKKTK